MTNFIAMFFVVVKNYKGLNDEVTDFAEQGELRRAGSFKNYRRQLRTKQ
jgi:hypothetical protein